MSGTGPLQVIPPEKTVALALVKPFNDLLRQEFQAYKDETGYSNKQLAAELGLRSETAVIKYLAGKPEGDVARLETLIDDVMRSRLKRADARGKLTETNVSEEMESHLETIRKTNDIGLIKGPSGVGKSCGGQLYVVKNPTSILIAASALLRRGPDVIALLWEELKPRQWHNWKGTHRSEILRKLAGSNRLLIVDDAHRLSMRGLDVIFAVHNETEIPIALFCHDEDLEKMAKRDAQMFSRIGQKWEVKLKTTRELAAHLVDQFLPEEAAADEELMTLAVQVISELGYGRALRKQLLLAREIKENLDATRRRIDWPTAFRSAHQKLIRSYELSTGEAK